MDIQEYLDNLARLKRIAEGRWGSLSTIERAVVEGSFDWLVDNLEIKKGEVIVDEDLARIMDEFMKAVVDIINEVPLYQSKLKRFLQDLTTIQNNNKAFHITTNQFNIETAGVTDVQKAVVGEIIEQYTGNGLNAHFAEPLKDGIYRNILAGASMRDVKETLKTYILSGQDKSGKLGSYLDQTAQQAVDSYTGAINQQLVSEFVFTGYIISGSLIDTSSKQCVEAVETSKNGYLSFKEWEGILDIARNNPKAKLIPGTTIKNLPLNKLHWGCRHDFTPVVMNEKKEKKKEEPVDQLINRAKEAGPEVDKKATTIAKKHDATITPINYKSRASILRKAKDEYNGDISQIKDAVRTTIVVNKPGDIDLVLKDLGALPETVRIKKQEANKDPLGYSGSIVNFKASNGLISEIQVNTPEMIFAKEKPEDAIRILGLERWQEIKDKYGLEGGLGHKYYEEWRELDKQEPKNLTLLAEIEALSTKYYNSFR